MGIFDWAKRKGAENANYAKKIVGTEDVKATSKEIMKMAKIVLNPKHAIENSKKETFLQAKERLKVTDAQIAQNYKNMVYSFYIAFGFSMLCFMGVLYSLFIKTSILSAFSMLAIFLMCLANSFKFSFRAFQIKHQKLVSVKEWWNRAGEWFPKLP
jgi:hypothetical protein